ncbi:MAG: CBS domain-containing protein [Candidatus Symbiothrix sp.]|jgi:CBS domain-containing protein|nr:CBS domain-containing protein [Candidatus Symbiothrix sp.]
MFSKEFLTNEIPVLNLHDTGNFALSQMEDYKLKHLPVVNEGRYVFLISEKDVFGMENPKDSIENISIYAPLVNEDTSILEVLQVIVNNRVTVLPVVNSQGEYLGAITYANLLEKLGELCNAGHSGSLIALELNPQDYSLGPIVHLVEQNNAKVLNVFSFMEEKTDKLVVLLKIDLEDAANILRSLERFNYPVRYYAQKQMLTDEIMRSRLNELMFYLEL